MPSDECSMSLYLDCDCVHECLSMQIRLTGPYSSLVMNKISQVRLLTSRGLVSTQALKVFVHSHMKAETFRNRFVDCSVHVKLLSKL